MGVRLVVSGQQPDGKSVIVSDEIMEPINAGILVTPLWGADEPPRFPLSGARPDCPAAFPTAGAYRFRMISIPPDGDLWREPAKISEADLKRLGAGVQDVLEEDNPGMHTTDTVDFEVVVSGEASIELDDGIVTHLQVGDCF